MSTCRRCGVDARLNSQGRCQDCQEVVAIDPTACRCRRCRRPLTVATARRYHGRWVGACRPCEAVESAARKRRRRAA